MWLPGQTFVPPNVPAWEFHPGFTDTITCGYLFMSAFNPVSVSTYYPTNMILDSHGDLAWYYSSNRRKLDFKLLPNGLISWYDFGDFFLMDSTFSIVDTISIQNNRNPDSHELLVDDNGHYWLLGTRDTTADLSNAITRFGISGSTEGNLKYGLIQELDAQGNLIKEWDGGPTYFDPEDIQRDYFNTASNMDLMHVNSIDLDPTTNTVLLSSRNVSEITCIYWPTGAVLWRFGGDNNEFTFANNDVGPNSQHYARFQSGGISLFDNGNFHAQPKSRGVRYQLDIQNRIATRLWSFTQPSQLSEAMGSFEILPNGSRLIGWGLVDETDPDDISYINSNSSQEFSIRLTGDYTTYRTTCKELPFTLDRPVIQCSESDGAVTLSIQGNHSRYLWSTGETTPTINITQKAKYQVFVPSGIGWVGSRAYDVIDITNPCALVGLDEELQEPHELLGTWDVLGRPVKNPQPGQVYIQRYSDGSTQKRILIQ